ncbi:MAG: hypothetical protein WD794_15875 [Mycobacteriales bacterium]
MRKRVLATAPACDATPSVFLLMPTAPDELAPMSAVHPMLDNGRTDVEGQLWFVGPPVVRGVAAPLSVDSDDAIWQQVEELGLGAVPAVLYDPRCSPPTVRFYPNGLADADNCRTTEIAGTAGVTLDAVFECIDHLHLTELVTPDAQSELGRLWRDPGKGWPVPQAELTVQMHLRTALNAWFPTCTIRPEQSQVSGRLDLEVEERDESRPAGFVRHAVLELKVLRSRNSTGASTSAAQTEKWVEEGVEQAFAYRSERDALASALCCFDMRAQHDDPFGAVSEKAATLQVALRAWPLFPSAKKWRKWLTVHRLDVGGDGATP